MRITPARKAKFQKTIWDFYAANKRDSLPWRKKITPYKVWISEIMLQQTQVERVKIFFDKWMKEFPTIEKLADAKQIDVLKLWKGLGYNSRAIRMKKTAEIVSEKYSGKFPSDFHDILDLPGIGPYTAGAITAFAYDKRAVFIETNIRRVFIHHFFKDSQSVHDRDILDMIDQTLPEQDFRNWYLALMDYGAHLGRELKVAGKKYNPNVRSRHYSKQSKFEGSDRQIRSRILDSLLKKRKIVIEYLHKNLNDLSQDPERIERIVSNLERDGFVEIRKGIVFLK